MGWWVTLPPISRRLAACAVGGRVGGDDDGNDGDAGEQSVTVAYPVSQSDCNQPVTQLISMRGTDRQIEIAISPPHTTFPPTAADANSRTCCQDGTDHGYPALRPSAAAGW